MQPEFMKLSVIERENLLMLETLHYLRKLGGVASRKQIVKEMKESSRIIPENYIDYTKASAKTGNFYKPFNYQFNFAVKHLTLAGFIVTPKKGSIELTEKGRTFNLDIFDSLEHVREISQPLMDQQSEEKRGKKNNETLLTTISNEIEDAQDVQDDENWRADLLHALKKMIPQRFELFSRRLVKEMGVDIDENIGVRYVGDGGIDGYGYITSDDFRTARVAIQAKRWEGKVSAPEIDKFRGAMDKFNAEFGIFITTSEFSREAINAARTGTRVITLIDGDKIADLVAQYELYVTPITTYELGEFYFK